MKRIAGSMKYVAKNVLHGLGFELRRLQASRKSDALIDFDRSGKQPWSPGYHVAKRLLIETAISNHTVLNYFKNGSPLPLGFGVGIDERCVEYPWVFSQLPKGPARLLDAGSTFNHDFILEAPEVQNKKLHIMTLAPEENCYWQKGVSYLFEDLREMPLISNLYDLVICISTLEHVGLDNSLYTRNPVHREVGFFDFVRVMQEMRRVLKPGGTFLLTVPFGKYESHLSFQQFDSPLLSRAIDAFGPTLEQKRSYYRYSSNGWNVSTEAECSGCEYVEWLAKVWDGHPWPDPLPRETDLAAAARAIACVCMIKGE